MSSSIKKVALRTADEKEFVVEEEVVRQFGTISSFLDEKPEAGSSGEEAIPLLEVQSKTLAKIIAHTKAHLEFSERVASAAEEGKKAVEEEAKKFDREFVKGEGNEGLKELILAANYLNIKELLNMLNQAVADRIANKSVEYVRRFFSIENDYTTQEEEEIKNQNLWAFEGVDPDDDD